MALTFTDKLGGLHIPLGGKAFRAYEVTHDGSETSIDASDFELSYFDTAIAGPGTQVLSATSVAYADLTTTQGKSLAMTALSSGATTVIWAIGF
jgi:hypothetical protein